MEDRFHSRYATAARTIATTATPTPRPASAPVVRPPLVDSVLADPEITVADGDDEAEETEEDVDGLPESVETMAPRPFKTMPS